MTESLKKNIHIIYSIVLSVMLAVAGVCLIVACVGIYNSGSRPFTPESVAAAFAAIAVPVYICIGLVLGGFVLHSVIPYPKKKPSAVRQDAARLAKLHRKLDMESAPQADSIKKEQNRRRQLQQITFLLLAFGCIAFLVYGTNPHNFHQSEINASMTKAMYVLLPCMAIPFGVSVYATFACRNSIQKEIALLIEGIAAGYTTSKPAPAPVVKEQLPWLRYALLVLAVSILVYGYFAGGTNDVLTKAINICTECVGLG